MFLSVSTQAMNTQVPGSGWPFVNESWSDIMAASGSSPSRDKDQRSGSPYQADTAAARKRHRILVVEDNKADVFLIREAIEAAEVEADLEIVQDGERALRFFDHVDGDHSVPCPVLAIIDINLPRRHGGEVIQEMRKSRRCANTLVLVVTSSDSAKDRDSMAKLGVNGYFCKPSKYDDFMKLGEIVKILVGSISEAAPPSTAAHSPGK